MLFKQKVLSAIAERRVTVAFRRWKRPTVKPGGRLRTAVGELAILAVDRIRENDISAEDAKAAGFADRARLIRLLNQRPEGDLYRIRFRLEGPDTRIALREATDFQPGELVDLIDQLRRFDANSTSGSWTARVLAAIDRHPEVPAAELSRQLGFEKEWLKTHVRKLKNLGLTESLSPGYRLSPRGRLVLEALGASPGKGRKKSGNKNRKR